MPYNATCPACGLKRTWSRDMQDPGCSCTKNAELKRKISLQNRIEMSVNVATKSDEPEIQKQSVDEPDVETFAEKYQRRGLSIPGKHHGKQNETPESDS